VHAALWLREHLSSRAEEPLYVPEWFSLGGEAVSHGLPVSLLGAAEHACCVCGLLISVWVSLRRQH
jgi:hypothetical protein